MERKEFGIRPKLHKAVDTRHYLTQTDQQDFELVGTGQCSIQQDHQGFE